MIPPGASVTVDISPSLKQARTSQEQMTNAFSGRLSSEYEQEGYDLLGSSCVDPVVSVDAGRPS